MLFSSQPALRHFAVLKRVKGRRYGAIWLVKDRRGLGVNQYLLVPSKVMAWPLLLSALNQYQASPVRLRNGKVALLIGLGDVSQIVEAIRKAKFKSPEKLNAISGFELATSSSRKKPVVALVLIAVIAIVSALIPKPEIADVEVLTPLKKEKQIDRCALPIEVDSQVVGLSAKSKSITISGFKYKVASMQKLGGLTQLKLKRTCDQKYFRVDAWSQNNQVVVSKVY